MSQEENIVKDNDFFKRIEKIEFVIGLWITLLIAILIFEYMRDIIEIIFLVLIAKWYNTHYIEIMKELKSINNKLRQ